MQSASCSVSKSVNHSHRQLASISVVTLVLLPSSTALTAATGGLLLLLVVVVMAACRCRRWCSCCCAMARGLMRPPPEEEDEETVRVEQGTSRATAPVSEAASMTRQRGGWEVRVMGGVCCLPACLPEGCWCPGKGPCITTYRPS